MPQPLPQYRCDKTVEAFPIGEIRIVTTAAGTTVTLVPADPALDPVVVNAAYCTKHLPRVGGYYVRYPNDGYESFSPAGPFEAGYTRLPGTDAP